MKWFLLIVLIIAAGCSPAPAVDGIQPQDNPLAPHSPTESELCPAQEPCDPSDRFGGGVLQEGPLVIDLSLVKAAAYGPNAQDPANLSDLEGVGYNLVWTYYGQSVSQTVTEYWGIAPDLTGINEYSSLVEMDGQHREGGIKLPAGEVEAGKTFDLVFYLDTPDGRFGAALNFSLQADADGLLLPANVSLRAYE
jgi:hypothetical protein